MVGPTEQTPKKPEYLIVQLQFPKPGPLVRSHSIFDGIIEDGIILMVQKSWDHQLREIPLFTTGFYESQTGDSKWPFHPLVGGHLTP